MNDYIRFCACKRLILTSEQMRNNKLCEECQKEHADSLKQRIEEAQEK